MFSLTKNNSCRYILLFTTLVPFYYSPRATITSDSGEWPTWTVAMARDRVTHCHGIAGHCQSLRAGLYIHTVPPSSARVPFSVFLPRSPLRHNRTRSSRNVIMATLYISCLNLKLSRLQRNNYNLCSLFFVAPSKIFIRVKNHEK